MLQIDVQHTKDEPGDEARVQKVHEGVKLIAEGLNLSDVKRQNFEYPDGRILTIFTAG